MIRRLKAFVSSSSNKQRFFTFIAVWGVSTYLVAIMSEGEFGFVVNHVLERSAPKAIAANEELDRVTSVFIEPTQQQHVLTVCFNARLAYTEHSKEYHIRLKFDEIGYRFSRNNAIDGCPTIAGAIELPNWTDRVTKEGVIDGQYYLHRGFSGMYSCQAEAENKHLWLGCVVGLLRPKQPLYIYSDSYEYQYITNSKYRYWLPLAWLADFLVAPFVLVGILFMYLLIMPMLFGGIPGMP